MRGVSQRDRIRNDYVLGSLEVADIRDKVIQHGIEVLRRTWSGLFWI